MCCRSGSLSHEHRRHGHSGSTANAFNITFAMFCCATRNICEATTKYGRQSGCMAHNTCILTPSFTVRIGTSSEWLWHDATNSIATIDNLIDPHTSIAIIGHIANVPSRQRLFIVIVAFESQQFVHVHSKYAAHRCNVGHKFMRNTNFVQFNGSIAIGWQCIDVASTAALFATRRPKRINLY